MIEWLSDQSLEGYAVALGVLWLVGAQVTRTVYRWIGYRGWLPRSWRQKFMQWQYASQRQGPPDRRTSALEEISKRLESIDRHLRLLRQRRPPM